MPILADRKLAEEFRKDPCGIHSEDLKRLLERFRGVPMPGKHVLIELDHYGPWQVARLGQTRRDPVEPIEGALFDRIEDAEWYVFRQRWADHFGETLAQ